MSEVVTIQEEIVLYLKRLRDQLCAAFEEFEEKAEFERKEWEFQEKGGGEISLLRGDTFEKAGVNWSGIEGSEFPMKDGVGPFFATGVSLITHMVNPHAPTAHFNLRYIETEKGSWFAGGYDLTPMPYRYEEDTEHFHGVAKATLDQFDHSLYPLFSKNAKEYFYIPHWKCERGVGGIFFDHYSTGHFDADFALWKSIGDTFLDALLPILQRRVGSLYSSEEKDAQLRARARYVEFNLLYDRGTQFGFRSGGNPEAILTSMPPLVKW